MTVGAQQSGSPVQAGFATHTLNEVGESRRDMAHGQLLHAVCDEVRLPDGGLSVREYIVHPGAVMIIALTDAGEVILERQFRYPIGRVMVEFPAGKLDPQERSALCAQRELLEETGYRAGRWAYAGTIHPVISYSTEHIDIWFAKDLHAGAQQLDEGEFLEVFTAAPEQLMQWCLDGTVTDAKTLAGAFWLQQVMAGTCTLAWRAADQADTGVPDTAYRPTLGTTRL